MASTGFATLSVVPGFTTPASAAPAQGAGIARTRIIAAAASAFLERLDPGQRSAVQFPFVPQPQAMAAHFKGGLRGDVDMVGERYGRAMWSNFPVSDVPRPGLPLGSMDAGQRTAVMDLLRVVLSDRGYRKVLDIMGSDQALADAGQPYACGRSAYTLAIFRTPGPQAPWMVQFGGHQLALNATLAEEHGVLAPVLTGCLPAIYTQNAQQVRALAAENDKAFALLGALHDTHRAEALIDHRVSDLALGPGHDGEAITPVGLAASTLDAGQRAMLYDLVLEWAGILNDDHAAPRLEEIRSGLEATRFAWSGPLTHETDRYGASYFRIQGPNLFIEFAPQEPGGDLTMHVHTIYRDASNAYGRAVV